MDPTIALMAKMTIAPPTTMASTMAPTMLQLWGSDNSTAWWWLQWWLQQLGLLLTMVPTTTADNGSNNNALDNNCSDNNVSNKDGSNNEGNGLDLTMIAWLQQQWLGQTTMTQMMTLLYRFPAMAWADKTTVAPQWLWRDGSNNALALMTTAYNGSDTTSDNGSWLWQQWLPQQLLPMAPMPTPDNSWTMKMAKTIR